MEFHGELGKIQNKQNQIITEKIRDFVLFLIDILLLILKICYYICESLIKSIIPMKKKSVAGEIVLITGAGHGIGKQLAIDYASLGATVVCWDINQETNKQTMNEIKQMGKNSVYAYKCDVSNREEVFNVAEKVRKEVGNVTILVNNAGIIVFKTLVNFTKEEIDQVINVNLKSHYWTLQAFLPSMIENNYGHIVAVASLAAFQGTKFGTVYCVTKSAIAALMPVLEQELRVCSNETSAIKFTTVYPSIVLTGIINKFKMRYHIKSSILLPKQISSLTIDAQRRNLRNVFIPSYMSSMNIIRLLPIKVTNSIMNFIGLEFQ